MSTETRWGILATGKIARSFATDLREVPGARLAAVGSRTPGSAEAFAATYGDGETQAHASYESLVADPDVDVVYVASPHALHLEHARLAFEAGKPVLCEKPLTLNAREAEQMVEAAGDLFLMEAMWTACHPLVVEMRRRLQAGDFGTPRQLHADLGFVVGEQDPGHRLVSRDLGAGALLDMGIYPLTFAHLMLGEAEQLEATAVLQDGIDVDIAIAGRHTGGAVSAMTASMTSASPRTATIATDQGRLDVAADFHHPPYAVWTPAGGSPEHLTAPEPVLGTGLGNEALHVQQCLADGLTESPLVPHAQTLTLMRQMDELRRQVGVEYAADTQG